MKIQIRKLGGGGSGRGGGGRLGGSGWMGTEKRSLCENSNKKKLGGGGGSGSGVRVVVNGCEWGGEGRVGGGRVWGSG